LKCAGQRALVHVLDAVEAEAGDRDVALAARAASDGREKD
jgi:hypothetical protein